MVPVAVNLPLMDYLVVSLPSSDIYCWVSDPPEGAEARTKKKCLQFIRFSVAFIRIKS